MIISSVGEASIPCGILKESSEVIINMTTKYWLGTDFWGNRERWTVLPIRRRRLFSFMLMKSLSLL